jgi:hypothetical protein
MDPITHTLTGGAIAGFGLRRVSPGATATLILASNAPDVDALAYFGDPYWALAFRRLQSPRVRFQTEALPKLEVTPGTSLFAVEVMEAAREDPRLRGYLVWSRFPHFQVVPLPGGAAEVRVGDARFAGVPGAGRLSGLRVEVGQVQAGAGAH